MTAFRTRIHDENQVYVNLNDILSALADAEDNPGMDLNVYTLEKVERMFLNIGIKALVASTNEALDSIQPTC